MRVTVFWIVVTEVVVEVATVVVLVMVEGCARQEQAEEIWGGEEAFRQVGRGRRRAWL